MGSIFRIAVYAAMAAVGIRGLKDEGVFGGDGNSGSILDILKDYKR